MYLVQVGPVSRWTRTNRCWPRCWLRFCNSQLLLAYCEICRMFCTVSVSGRLTQHLAGALDSLVPNGFRKPRLYGLCGHQLQNRVVRRQFSAMFRSVATAVVPRFYRSLLLSVQQFQGAFDGFYWPTDFASTRNMIARLFISRSISDFFVGVIAGLGCTDDSVVEVLFRPDSSLPELKFFSFAPSVSLRFGLIRELRLSILHRPMVIFVRCTSNTSLVTVVR